jgi:hypothetical protein
MLTYIQHAALLDPSETYDLDIEWIEKARLTRLPFTRIVNPVSPCPAGCP